MKNNVDIQTLLAHGDKFVEDVCDISPPIHLSTTYASNNSDGLIYSRDDNITRRRAEAAFGKLERGMSLMFSSGQAASMSILVQASPKRILYDSGYFGTKDAIQLYCTMTGAEICSLDNSPKAGDIIWIETPNNPSGNIYQIEEHAKRAKDHGALLVVDSTLATPIFQRPILLGADYAVHSLSKYVGGHSDVIAGLVTVGDKKNHSALNHVREIMGNVPGSLEVWLILRSLKTLNLRVKAQFSSALKIVEWLRNQHWVLEVSYTNVGIDINNHNSNESNQLNFTGGVFLVRLESVELAKNIPSLVEIFNDATSLGGVESLIEWRHKHDKGVDPDFVRVAIGIENYNDLINDLNHAYIKYKSV